MPSMRARLSVEVVRPQKSTAGLDLVLPGNVQAFLDTPIYARTNGYLKKWYADIGAHVKNGQLLAEIDTPEVDDQLRAARADLANANANYALAKSTADRWTDMLKSKSVSKQETDEKVGDMLAKKATLDAARFNVARLEKTQSFQKVYAPFDGIVTARNVDVGALIDAGSSGGPAKELFHVAQADRLRVYVNVPQAYAQQVRAQQTAFLTLTETPSKHYPGTVARTAGAVDPQQRTMLVEVDVDNRNGDLLPGAYAQVHFALGTGAAPFTLPGNALLFRPDGVKVATVDAQHKVKLVPVSLGTDFGTRVAIVSGLQGDEQVILNPQDSIVDGAPVRIVPARRYGRARSCAGRRSGRFGAAGRAEQGSGMRCRARRECADRAHASVQIQRGISPDCAVSRRASRGRHSSPSAHRCRTLRGVARPRLTACTVGPDYVKPPATTAATYKELEGTGWKPAQPADTLTRGAWWSVYADPSLDALEQQVASANQNVQAAEARFRAARATVAQYRSSFFPVVTANRRLFARAVVGERAAQIDRRPHAERLPRASRRVVGTRPVGPRVAQRRRRESRSAGQRRRRASRAPVDAGRTRDRLLRAARTRSGAPTSRRHDRGLQAKRSI